jgi:hypothetical protein
MLVGARDAVKWPRLRFDEELNVIRETMGIERSWIV